MLETQRSLTESDRNRERLESISQTYFKVVFVCGTGPGKRGYPSFWLISMGFSKPASAVRHCFSCMQERKGSTRPAEVAKHCKRVTMVFDGIVVYSADRLPAGFRARLIAAGIAFAVPGNQLFVPELATDLREHFRVVRTSKPNKLSPSAQLVLFYHLLNGEKLRPTAPTELAERLQYSTMTVSRAFDELGAAELAKVEKRGRKKFLSFSGEWRSLIEKAKSLLINPERRLVHVRWAKEPMKLPLAGLHALARRSDLNPPSGPPVYAVTRKNGMNCSMPGWLVQRKCNTTRMERSESGNMIRGYCRKTMWSIRYPCSHSSGTTQTNAYPPLPINCWSDGYGERTRAIPGILRGTRKQLRADRRRRLPHPFQRRGALSFAPRRILTSCYVSRWSARNLAGFSRNSLKRAVIRPESAQLVTGSFTGFIVPRTIRSRK